MTLSATFDKTSSQKLLASFLDKAAARSMYPASGKQCWFLAKLIVDTCETEDQFDMELADWTKSNMKLSGKEASTLIGQYLEEAK